MIYLIYHSEENHAMISSLTVHIFLQRRYLRIEIFELFNVKNNGMRTYKTIIERFFEKVSYKQSELPLKIFVLTRSLHMAVSDAIIFCLKHFVQREFRSAHI